MLTLVIDHWREVPRRCNRLSELKREGRSTVANDGGLGDAADTERNSRTRRARRYRSASTATIESVSARGVLGVKARCCQCSTHLQSSASDAPECRVLTSSCLPTSFISYLFPSTSTASQTSSPTLKRTNMTQAKTETPRPLDQPIEIDRLKDQVQLLPPELFHTIYGFTFSSDCVEVHIRATSSQAYKPPTTLAVHHASREQAAPS